MFLLIQWAGPSRCSELRNPHAAAANAAGGAARHKRCARRMCDVVIRSHCLPIGDADVSMTYTHAGFVLVCTFYTRCCNCHVLLRRGFVVTCFFKRNCHIRVVVVVLPTFV